MPLDLTDMARWHLFYYFEFQSALRRMINRNQGKAGFSVSAYSERFFCLNKSFVLKWTWSQNIFLLKLVFAPVWKALRPSLFFFAKCWLFTYFKTYNKSEHQLVQVYTTESEGAWIFSWFGITNCSACAMQISLWLQININHPRPFLLDCVSTDVYFFVRFEAQ